MKYIFTPYNTPNTEIEGLKLRNELTEKLSTCGLDRITLRFNYHHLNGDLWKNWTKTNISIECHGPFSFVTFHPPLINSEDILLKQIIDNLIILCCSNVFSHLLAVVE